MTLTDLLIIYLACGTPFSAHFLIHRDQRRDGLSIAYGFLVTAVWPVYALVFLDEPTSDSARHTYQFANGEDSDLNESKSTIFVTNDANKFLSYIESPAKVFEFREVVDRYAGLTSAVFEWSSGENVNGYEIYKVSNHPKAELGAICLNRRNLNRVLSHQKLAREDFLSMLWFLAHASGNPETIEDDAVRFVDRLGDKDAHTAIKSLFIEFREKPASVMSDLGMTHYGTSKI